MSPAVALSLTATLITFPLIETSTLPATAFEAAISKDLFHFKPALGSAIGRTHNSSVVLCFRNSAVITEAGLPLPKSFFALSALLT